MNPLVRNATEHGLKHRISEASVLRLDATVPIVKYPREPVEVISRKNHALRSVHDRIYGRIAIEELGSFLEKMPPCVR
jgi:hypothetical protein